MTGPPCPHPVAPTPRPPSFRRHGVALGYTAPAGPRHPPAPDLGTVTEGWVPEIRRVLNETSLDDRGASP